MQLSEPHTASVIHYRLSNPAPLPLSSPPPSRRAMASCAVRMTTGQNAHGEDRLSPTRSLQSRAPIAVRSCPTMDGSDTIARFERDVEGCRVLVQFIGKMHLEGP